MTRLAVSLTALFLLAGAALRFHAIGNFSLWEDELFSVATATRSGPWYGPLQPGKDMLQLQLADSFWTWKFADPHPPLYEMLLTPWIGLFGTSDFAIRSLSVVSGILAMLSVFALPRPVTWPVRAVYVLLMAASAPLLIYSQEARGYSLGVCLAAWLLALMLRQMDNDRASLQEGRPGALLVFVAALLSLTHYYGVLMTAAVAAMTMVQVRSVAAALRAALRWSFAFVPIAVYVVLGWAGIKAKLGAAPPDALSFAMAFQRNTIAFLHNTSPRVHEWAFWAFMALCSLGLVILWRLRAHGHALFGPVLATTGVLVIFFVVLALGTRRAEFFSPRYAIFMVPGCLLLIAMFTSVKGWPRIVAAALVLFLVPSGLQVWQLSPRPQNGGDWRGAAALVASNYKPGDLIVLPINDPTMRAHFEHYLRNHIAADQLDRRLLVVIEPADLPGSVRASGSLPPRVIVFGHGAFMPKFNLATQALQTGFGCRLDSENKVQSLYVNVLSCGA